MTLNFRSSLPLLAVVLSACQPADLSGTVDGYVYALEGSGYVLEKTQIEHLESLRELRGRDIELRSGGELNVTLGGELSVVRGSAFALEFSIDETGAAVPGDLHSFFALSLYRNLDRSASLLRAHGFAPVAKLDVFYFPRLDNPILGDTRTQLTDNAAYASVANGFLIVPSFALSDLPLLLNEGVVAHEYGHAVVHQVLFGAAPEAPKAADRERHLGSMHEGVADLIGFCATGNPNFIKPSVDIDRDLSVPVDYTSEDLTEISATPSASLFSSDGFDPHHHGSVMARAIYELWPKDGSGKVSEAERGRLLDVTLAALRAVKYEPGFTLASFPDAVVRELPLPDRLDACRILRRRLAPFAAQLTACGDL